MSCVRTFARINHSTRVWTRASAIARLKRKRLQVSFDLTFLLQHIRKSRIQFQLKLLDLRFSFQCLVQMLICQLKGILQFIFLLIVSGRYPRLSCNLIGYSSERYFTISWTAVQKDIFFHNFNLKLIDFHNYFTCYCMRKWIQNKVKVTIDMMPKNTLKWPKIYIYI